MKKYGCTSCAAEFDTFEEALPHHDQIGGHNIYTTKDGHIPSLEESGDKWRIETKESFSNGTCPVCFCSDGGPHSKGCEWYEMEYRIRILEKSSDLNANISASAIERAIDMESRISVLETQFGRRR